MVKLSAIDLHSAAKTTRKRVLLKTIVAHNVAYMDLLSTSCMKTLRVAKKTANSFTVGAFIVRSMLSCHC